jgi:lysophospholipase L1-like esterase
VADGGVLDARNTFDGVHLSARAYVLWSAALAPVLREALR